jgi:hypothetical protein
VWDSAAGCCETEVGHVTGLAEKLLDQRAWQAKWAEAFVSSDGFPYISQKKGFLFLGNQKGFRRNQVPVFFASKHFFLTGRKT